MKKILILMTIVYVVTFAEVKFEDISKDHWAYSAVNSLVKKGIISEKKYNFDGEENLKRYDFAVILARAVDNIELEKANKKDLDILEALMLEFSQELNRIGFDTKMFSDRLGDINKNIEILKERINESEKEIQELKKRIKALE